MNPLGAHLQANFASVKGGPTAGSQHSGAPDGGSSGSTMPGSVPLQGHFQQPALQARGNSAKRGPGRKSPSNPTEMT